MGCWYRMEKMETPKSPVGLEETRDYVSLTRRSYHYNCGVAT